MSIKIKVNDFTIKQGIGELKQGYWKKDFSRISAYNGSDQGVHTGANSPTLIRGGKEPLKNNFIKNNNL